MLKKQLENDSLNLVLTPLSLGSCCFICQVNFYLSTKPKMKCPSSGKFSPTFSVGRHLLQAPFHTALATASASPIRLSDLEGTIYLTHL